MRNPTRSNIGGDRLKGYSAAAPRTKRSARTLTIRLSGGARRRGFFAAALRTRLGERTTGYGGGDRLSGFSAPIRKRIRFGGRASRCVRRRPGRGRGKKFYSMMVWITGTRVRCESLVTFISLGIYFIFYYYLKWWFPVNRKNSDERSPTRVVHRTGGPSRYAPSSTERFLQHNARFLPDDRRKSPNPVARY